MSSLRNVSLDRTPRPKGKEPGRNHPNHIPLHLKMTIPHIVHQRVEKKNSFLRAGVISKPVYYQLTELTGAG